MFIRTKQGASGALSVMGVPLEQYSTSGTVGVLLEQFMLCTATDVLLGQTVDIRYWPVCTLASMYTPSIRYCCGFSVRINRVYQVLSVSWVCFFEQYSTSGNVGVLLEQT